MNCPKCGYGYSKVIEARKHGNVKRRRRECSGCGLRYTSYEMFDMDYEKIIHQKNQIKKAINILEGLSLEQD